MKKVLIADLMHDSIEEMLRGIGFEPDYRPKIKREEILAIIADYHGLVIRSKTEVDKELIDAAKLLQFVGRAGAGIDKCDVDYLKEKGVVLFNAPEGNRDAVGEQTIGTILTLMGRINRANKEVKNGVWDREGNRGWELKDKTVGIFGFGFMGAAMGKKLRGFECPVIAYDKYKTDFGSEWIKEVDFDTFKKETEILSIHVPLTPETKGIFNRAFFTSFAKLKVVINTARGEVLKLADLLDLLEEGFILGAGLDVLENEKINNLSLDEQAVFDALRQRDNVVLTPHVAGWTFESYQRINQVLIDKIKASGLI